MKEKITIPALQQMKREGRKIVGVVVYDFQMAQIVDRETADGTTALLLELRRITEIDSTGARILGELDAALKIRGVKLTLILSGRTETAARLADIFQGDRFFPDIDRAIEWAEDELLAKTGTAPSEALPLDRLPLLSDPGTAC